MVSKGPVNFMSVSVNQHTPEQLREILKSNNVYCTLITGSVIFDKGQQVLVQEIFNGTLRQDSATFQNWGK